MRYSRELCKKHRESRKKKKAEESEGEEQVAADLVDVLLRLQEGGEMQIELSNDRIKSLILVTTVSFSCSQHITN